MRKIYWEQSPRDICKNKLIELGACERGLERFDRQLKSPGVGKCVSIPLAVLQTLPCNYLGIPETFVNDNLHIPEFFGNDHLHCADFMWLAPRILPKERIIRTIARAALIQIRHLKPFYSKSFYNDLLEILHNPNHCSSANLEGVINEFTSGDSIRITAMQFDAKHNDYRRGILEVLFLIRLSSIRPYTFEKQPYLITAKILKVFGDIEMAAGKKEARPLIIKLMAEMFTDWEIIKWA